MQAPWCLLEIFTSTVLVLVVAENINFHFAYFRSAEFVCKNSRLQKISTKDLQWLGFSIQAFLISLQLDEQRIMCPMGFHDFLRRVNVCYVQYIESA